MTGVVQQTATCPTSAGRGRSGHLSAQLLLPAGAFATLLLGLALLLDPLGPMDAYAPLALFVVGAGSLATYVSLRYWKVVPAHVRNTCAGGARRSDLDSDGPAEWEWNRVGGPPARPHHEPWLGMASAVRPGKPRGRDLDLLAPSRTSTLGSGGNRVHLGGGPFARKGRESRGIPCPELLSRGPVRAGIRWGHPSDAGIETFPELRRGGGPERDPHGSW